MKPLNILEIFLYVLLNFAPSLLLALIPFRRSLRFSGKKTALFLLLLYQLMVTSRILCIIFPSTAIAFTILWVILYFGFYIFLTKAPFTQLLFVLLNILNYNSVTVIIFTYIVSRYFSAYSTNHYSLAYSLVFFMVLVVTYPFVYYLVRCKMTPLITSSENNRYWRYLWLLPSIFCLTYYYNLYTNGGVIAYSSRLNNLMFALFFNLGSLFVTVLVIQLLRENNDNLKLKSELYHLNMHSLQYENLQNRIEDALSARHDLRQTLAALYSYIQNGSRDELLSYIQNYMDSLPPDSPIVYCENNTVNALIVYYGDMAARHSISFDHNITFPEIFFVSNTDAVVLLGNLLENALESCLRRKNEETFISLCIKPIQQTLVITLDNSCPEPVIPSGDSFLSTKTGGSGLGISSIRKIVEKYKGIIKMNYDGEQFHVSAILCL